MTPQDMAITHAAAFRLSRAWSKSEFVSLLADPPCFAVGDTRAFALGRVVLDEAELLTIATHPDHQRQGLARRILAEWQAKSTTQGATRGFLEVAADNDAALALYTSCGFGRSGLRRRYYRREQGPAVDAIVMACTLP